MRGQLLHWHPSSVRECDALLQPCLDTIDAWLQRWKVTTPSVTKCTATLFSLDPRESGGKIKPHLTLRGEELPYARYPTFLGIKFDPQLTFADHVDDLKAKMARRRRWTSRREEVQLCRLRIGHTLATNRYLLCRDTRPTCSHCEENLTVIHVLVSCRDLALERARFFGGTSLDMKELLDECTGYMSNVFRFLGHPNFSVIFSRDTYFFLSYNVFPVRGHRSCL